MLQQLLKDLAFNLAPPLTICGTFNLSKIQVLAQWNLSAYLGSTSPAGPTIPRITLANNHLRPRTVTDPVSDR